MAILDFVVDAAFDVIAQLQNVGFCGHDAEIPAHDVGAGRVVIQDHAFTIEMELDFFCPNQFIKHDGFLEAPLNPIHSIGYQGYNLFLFLGELDHLVKFFAVALGGGFDNFENLENFEILALAVFLKPGNLGVNAVALFLFLGGNAGENDCVHGVTLLGTMPYGFNILKS